MTARSILAVLCLLPAMPVNAGTQLITLEQAINKAVSNNLSLASLQYSLASSRVVLQSKQDFFKLNLTPELRSERGADGETSSARIIATRRTAAGTTLSASAGTEKYSPEDIDPVYRSSINFQIRQPLLRNAGREINMEPVVVAERNVINSLRELTIRRTDLIVQVAESHETLLSTQRQIEYQERTIERLLLIQKLTAAREKQGRASKVDTMRSDLRLGNARLRLTSLKDRLATEQSNFAELLGADPSLIFTALPGDIPVVNIPEKEEAAACALSNRLDLAQIIDDIEDARRGVRIARRNMLPDLTLIANYELKGEADSLSGSQKLEDDIWFVGFRISSDIALRDQRASLATAEISLDLSQLRLESVVLAIRKQVFQSISSYERILQERALAGKNYEIAKNRAQLAKRLFETGRGDSFSVAEAEDELLAAEEQLLASESAAFIASYKIKRVMGTLIEYPDELKPGKIK